MCYIAWCPQTALFVVHYFMNRGVKPKLLFEVISVNLDAERRELHDSGLWAFVVAYHATIHEYSTRDGGQASDAKVDQELLQSRQLLLSLQARLGANLCVILYDSGNEDDGAAVRSKRRMAPSIIRRRGVHRPEQDLQICFRHASRKDRRPQDRT